MSGMAGMACFEGFQAPAMGTHTGLLLLDAWLTLQRRRRRRLPPPPSRAPPPPPPLPRSRAPPPCTADAVNTLGPAPRSHTEEELFSSRAAFKSLGRTRFEGDVRGRPERKVARVFEVRGSSLFRSEIQSINERRDGRKIGNERAERLLYNALCLPTPTPSAFAHSTHPLRVCAHPRPPRSRTPTRSRAPTPSAFAHPDALALRVRAFRRPRPSPSRTPTPSAFAHPDALALHVRAFRRPRPSPSRTPTRSHTPTPSAPASAHPTLSAFAHTDTHALLVRAAHALLRSCTPTPSLSVFARPTLSAFAHSHALRIPAPHALRICAPPLHPRSRTATPTPSAFAHAHAHTPRFCAPPLPTCSRTPSPPPSAHTLRVHLHTLRAPAPFAHIPTSSVLAPPSPFLRLPHIYDHYTGFLAPFRQYPVCDLGACLALRSYPLDSTLLLSEASKDVIQLLGGLVSLLPYDLEHTDL
ncbi:hypothetical protein PLICRDRAFT_180654 [Plicaturopsis crispa FD-325 SS-3]|uniref:Uncharacterized protein n=1 Tax=Plicaturopsis crispa FD-325 SS-3 TaxID=944288 RepID=A0A0C9T4V3_PLICR|nr:hypothetical protein PLICRDRAFT_180654 [Plicaturopsis crispa FD-325 SS-3]